MRFDGQNGIVIPSVAICAFYCDLDLSWNVNQHQQRLPTEYCRTIQSSASHQRPLRQLYKLQAKNYRAFAQSDNNSIIGASIKLPTLGQSRRKVSARQALHLSEYWLCDFQFLRVSRPSAAERWQSCQGIESNRDLSPWCFCHEDATNQAHESNTLNNTTIISHIARSSSPHSATTSDQGPDSASSQQIHLLNIADDQCAESGIGRKAPNAPSGCATGQTPERAPLEQHKQRQQKLLSTNSDLPEEGPICRLASRTPTTNMFPNILARIHGPMQQPYTPSLAP